MRHSVAGDDQRTLGLAPGASAASATAAGSPRSRAATRVGAKQIDLALGFEDVARQRQEHRTGRRRQRGLRRAVHETRQVGEAMHLGRPFHQRPRDRRQVGPQDRLGGVEFLVVLAGGDEDRRACLLRVVEHAHGVAEPGRDVQVDHRELAGGLGIAVGHADHGRLLQAEHVAQLVVDRERVHQRQFGRAGIAEHDLDALLLEQLEEGAFSGHCGQSFLPRSSRHLYWSMLLRSRSTIRTIMARRGSKGRSWNPQRR